MAGDVFGYKIKNKVNIFKNHALQEIREPVSNQAAWMRFENSKYIC